MRHDTVTPDIETASQNYADRFRGPVGEWLLDVQRRYVRTLVPQSAGRPLRVLEVGGGHGQLTPTFLAAGHRVSVHASARSALGRVRALRTSYPDRLTFFVSSLWELPCDNDTFDLVAGIRLLAHVEAWRRLLAEMVRVSRRWILIDYPPRSSANVLTPVLFGVKRAIEGNTRPYFCYRDRAVRDELHRLGITRIHTERQLALPMALHRALGRATLSRRLERVMEIVGMTRRYGSPTLLIGDSVPHDSAATEEGTG